MDDCHSHNTENVFASLHSSPAGLNQQEAAQRLLKHGANALPEKKPVPAWLRFLLQFHNVLIYVLLVSAVISFLLGHLVDAGVILAVVVINSLVGFIQEGRANSALRAILAMASSQAMVLREGVVHAINARELVPGDVVMLQAGDKVPADLRIFYQRDLRCDETTLTGESAAVNKHSEAVAQNTPLALRTNMAFMGTMVTYGSGRGVVTHTGQNTQIGTINRLTQQVTAQATPLQRQLARLALQITLLTIGIALFSMAFGIFIGGQSFADMFQAAIGIAVAAIPEGLPALVTITLAIGVQRMARQRALVRRLPAVEVLGAVDVICSDKTGTLTANAMTVRSLYLAEGMLSVSGEGYAPQGAIAAHHSPAVLERAAQIALLCNDARLAEKDGQWQLHGDGTEGALVSFALKAGLNQNLRQQTPRLDELPFETARRYMASLHRIGAANLLLVKGAPEVILAACDQVLAENGPQPLQPDEWQAAINLMAARGERVLALAFKTLPDTRAQHADMQGGLTLVALLGMTDPPRAEVKEAISRCHGAGIRVVMITGDNPLTAAAIARELGLGDGTVLTGAELDALTPAQLSSRIEDVHVFARTSPANKLELVQALQAGGHVVAMTGDGVNDAPALRQADIGVAMGQKGTDAAKEAAAFVLTDDNFTTIANAVGAGRTVYNNIVKGILFLLPTSMAEAAVIVLAILLGMVLPITPAQILWVNMITAITLGLALAFERAEDDIMAHPPRRPGSGMLNLQFMLRLLLVTATGTAIVFALYLYALGSGHGLEYTRSMAVNGLVMFEAAFLLCSRYLHASILQRGFMLGLWPAAIAIGLVFALQLLFTYLPVSQAVFQVQGLMLHDWLLVIAASALVIPVVETEKFLWRRWRRK
ncbi:MAG: HAD-IC family P-type ATPase [Oceanospirillaceae bacterium]|nr:HAD-IC family P-type ATPase [Oceanospirillaceae bacterium]MCP5335999.1 HAD-IC family P-type ATPase [Oceanospirillaceae bacterium]